jgi:hypothetical protein
VAVAGRALLRGSVLATRLLRQALAGVATGNPGRRAVNLRFAVRLRSMPPFRDAAG